MTAFAESLLMVTQAQIGHLVGKLVMMLLDALLRALADECMIV